MKTVLFSIFLLDTFDFRCFQADADKQKSPGLFIGDPAAVARFRSGLKPPPDGVVAQGDRTRPRSSHKRISRKTKPPNKSEVLFW